MFAGPNGSGKSTIKSVIPAELVGAYINADDLEKEIRATGCIDLGAFGVHASQEAVHRFFQDSALLERAELTAAATAIHVRGTCLDFGQLQANSYFASVAADFIRRKLIGASASMTFETVMSSEDKIAFMREAQAAGHRTYLYYISTSDPAINVSRVKNRVRSGGHTVPEDKIISRYYRSMQLLTAAIRTSNRAYIFDNSTKDRIWLAEITDGSILETKTAEVTGWFKRYVLDRWAAADD